MSFAVSTEYSKNGHHENIMLRALYSIVTCSERHLFFYLAPTLTTLHRIR